jgi:hypothetical protein
MALKDAQHLKLSAVPHQRTEVLDHFASPLGSRFESLAMFHSRGIIADHQGNYFGTVEPADLLYARPDSVEYVYPPSCDRECGTQLTAERSDLSE